MSVLILSMQAVAQLERARIRLRDPLCVGVVDHNNFRVLHPPTLILRFNVYIQNLNDQS